MKTDNGIIIWDGPIIPEEECNFFIVLHLPNMLLIHRNSADYCRWNVPVDWFLAKCVAVLTNLPTDENNGVGSLNGSRCLMRVMDHGSYIRLDNADNLLDFVSFRRTSLVEIIHKIGEVIK